MKIRYRLAFEWKRDVVNRLQDLGVSVSPTVMNPSNGGFAVAYVDEGESGWIEAYHLVRDSGGSILYTTEFTEEEIARADYCALRPAHYSGYPQPEGDFGFRTVTYDVHRFCEACGVGLRQVAPFRVRRSLKWGRNDFLQLYWVPSEYFMKEAVWIAHLKGLGVRSNCVEDTKGRGVDGIVQLRIDDCVDMDVEDVGGVVCDRCKRVYYRPIERGFFPAPLGAPDAAIFRTRQYFGTGHNGFNEVIVNSSVAAAIIAGGLRGVKLWPCAPVRS